MSNRCPELLQQAECIEQGYSQLFTQYADYRKIFSCGTPLVLSSADIEELESCITKFLDTCRNQVVKRNLGNITPKLHLLERHAVPLIRTVRIGLGLLSEQGVESLHSKNYAQHTAAYEDRG